MDGLHGRLMNHKVLINALAPRLRALYWTFVLDPVDEALSLLPVGLRIHQSPARESHGR